MSAEVINVGQDFDVQCSTLPLANVQDYTSPQVYLRRPDGYWASLTPSVASGSGVLASVTALLNPVTGSAGRWVDGYPGPWEFYVKLTSGSKVYRSKKVILVVHPLGFGA